MDKRTLNKKTINKKTMNNKTISKKTMNNKTMDKKGFMKFELIMLFFKFFVLMVVLFTIIYLSNFFLIKAVDTQKGEMNLFADNLVYSKGGVSYYDVVIDRIYPGIIDINDIKNKNAVEGKLNHAFDFGKYPLMAALIEIDVDDNIEQEIGISFEGYNIYYNEEWYNKWIVLTGWGIGKGVVSRMDKTYYVLLRNIFDDKERFIPAKLKVRLLSPNS